MFIAVFILIKLLYSASMLVLNYINCEIEKMTKTNAFALSLFNESLLIDNISVFKNFNVVQMNIKRIDIH